jgi:elongation factor 2
MGTCAMGSALFGWAFTITKFAKVYAKKFGVEREKMMQKLWGDNWYDQKAKKWKNHNKADDETDLKRAFVTFIMEPIIRLCRAAMNGEMDKCDKMMATVEVSLKSEERQLQGKYLMKCMF